MRPAAQSGASADAMLDRIETLIGSYRPTYTIRRPRCSELARENPLDVTIAERNPTDRLVLHTRVVSGSGGGPDKTILNSPRFLRDQGYPMVCAYMRPPNDPLFSVIESRAEEWQAPLAVIDDRGPFDLGVLERFKELCRELQPAIWHGHDYKSNALGCWLRKSHPMALITTVHGWVKRTWKTPLYYAIDRATLGRHDHVICVSEDLMEACLRLGIPESRCTLVHNAIDTDYFKPHTDPLQAKASLGVDPHAYCFVGVGRLSAEKAFDQLIEAFARVQCPDRPLALCIAGEGDEHDRLEGLTRSLGLDARVKLLGFVNDTRNLYDAADAFVLSSLREGLPNVLLEAMAMNTPVLSTAIAGVPKLIQDGSTGLLVPPGDPQALSANMQRLVDDPGLGQALAVAARRWIEDHYSFRVRMDRIKAIYDRTLSDLG